MRLLLRLQERATYYEQQHRKCLAAIEVIEAEMGGDIEKTQTRKINGALNAHLGTSNSRDDEVLKRTERKQKWRLKVRGPARSRMTDKGKAKMGMKEAIIQVLTEHGPLRLNEMQPLIETLRGGPTTKDSISVTVYGLAKKRKLLRGRGQKGVVGLLDQKRAIEALEKDLPNPVAVARQAQEQEKHAAAQKHYAKRDTRTHRKRPDRNRRGNPNGRNIPERRKATMTVPQALLQVLKEHGGPAQAYMLMPKVERLRGAPTTRGAFSVLLRHLKRTKVLIGGTQSKAVYGLPEHSADAIVALENSLPSPASYEGRKLMKAAR